MAKSAMRRSLFSLCVALLLSAVAPLAAERSLSWRELAVTARLDADGVLHVRERHAMVFTGDWNGGERSFRLAPGQQLRLERVARLEPRSGEERALLEGDLDEIDHFAVVDGATLRWRSRRPSDPPFAATLIVTLIEYSQRFVVAERDGRYRLDHDFAFPDRAWPVERFVLDLELDPAWRTGEGAGQAFHYEPGALPPGRGLVVTANLSHAGPSRPSAVAHPIGRITAAVLIGLLGLSVGWGVARFRAREERPGRWAPLPVVSLDPARLESQLFSLRPEVAGALWDREVGDAEVTALLARLVAEGTLASEVVPGAAKAGEAKALRLRLLVARSKLSGYEAELIDKLFPDGTDVTDTETLKEHYASTGFSPSSVIKAGVLAEVDRVLGMRPARPRLHVTPTVVLFVAAAAALLLGGALGSRDWPVVGVGASIWLASWGLAAATAAVYTSPAVASLAAKAGVTLAMLVPATASYAALLLSSRPVGLLPLVGLGLALATAWHSTLVLMRARDRGPALERRRQLAALRSALAAELAKPSPELRDDWYPWLLALGLGSRVDRWVESFGAQVSVPASDRDGGVGGRVPGGSSAVGGWSGGGGSFGGGGASASWGAAAGALAAGVSAPSSSSSGGSGGGGSSSGGGGGGGW